MAPRKSPERRSSTEERRARARAERPIAMPTNRAPRPKAVSSGASAKPKRASSRSTAPRPRPSARAVARPKSPSKAASPRGRAAANAAVKRPAGASTTRRATSPSNRSRITTSQAKAPRNAVAPRNASAARPAPKRRGIGPRIALAAVLALVLLVGGAWAVDGAVNGSRIYAGISVGEVDVSGMTEEEARRAVSAYYEPRIAEGRALVFASEEARDTLDVESELAEQDAQAEQLSLEEARANKQLWVAEAGTLGAELPVSELVARAFAVGREGGLPERLSAAREGATVAAELQFDGEALDTLCASIDESAGEPRVDYGIAVEEGVVSVTEGHSGTAVDRDALSRQLSEGFLGSEPARVSIVAVPEQADVRIDADEAGRVAAQVQAALDRGCTFTFEQNEWSLGAADLGAWVRTRVEEGERAELVPYLDEAEVSAGLLGLIRDAGYASAATVTFDVDGGETWVSASEGSRYPHTAAAAEAADDALFGEGATGADAPSIAVQWGEAPSRVTFDEALQIGLIAPISSFTTEYNDSPSTANRRHNIHTAADLLDNSIARAGGGEWSFNDTVGEANEEAGFQAAHAIVNGEYDDAIGGGICQVATTVFNAVYEAGYPVTQRRNHSLYIASYPTGRDAAIAYPDLDLTWVNDGNSDVLMRSRYTDSTLTVTLYGIDPGYVVATQTGDWETGEPFKKRVKVDESEPEGTRYVKTVGADGRSVTVHRVVRDRAGNVLHEEDFTSNYAPIDEVTVVGPNTPTRESEDTGKEATDKEEASVLSAGD